MVGIKIMSYYESHWIARFGVNKTNFCRSASSGFLRKVRFMNKRVGWLKII